MANPTILLTGVPPATETALRQAFTDASFVALPDGRWVRERLRDLGAEAAVVSIEDDLEQRFRLVRDLAASGVRVLVLGAAKDPDLILRAMREGAREFAISSASDAVVRALREQVKPARADGGSVYAVFPAKGGAGATTVATNLAGALQRLGERTCLVDLNLTMGDVLAFLDLAGGYSISELLANMRRFDRELLDSSLMQHASGVHVLAQSHRIEDADRVEPGLIGGLIDFLRQHYRAVVVDGLRTFDEVSVAAIDACDQILLVVTQEVPAVRDAARSAQLFRRLGAERKLKLIVNRGQKGAEISASVVADTVGVPVAATIANDYPAVIRAINRGQLLFEEAPRARVTKDIEQLVTVLEHPLAGAEVQRESGSLFRRIFNPRTSHAT